MVKRFKKKGVYLLSPGRPKRLREKMCFRVGCVLYTRVYMRQLAKQMNEIRSRQGGHMLSAAQGLTKHTKACSQECDEIQVRCAGQTV